jgi:uncharacterized membrane protein YbhN (UPF0104 family)
MTLRGSLQRHRHKVGKLLPFLGLAIFSLAVWILYREVRNYDYHAILASFTAIPTLSIILASLLTLSNYLLISGYDFLALQDIKRPVQYRNIMFNSFIAAALSRNAGYSMLSGGAIRYRLYGARGLTALDITKVIFFSSATFWLGLLAASGVIFLTAPMFIPRTLHLPFTYTYSIGLLFVCLLLAYVALSVVQKPLRHRGLSLTFPPPRIAVSQILVSALDWLLAGLALYALIPCPALPLVRFLSIFFFAQFLGIVSQVPGGLGVFETVLLLLMPRACDRTSVLGAIIAFRLIYNVFPLGLGLLLLGGREFTELKGRFRLFTRR